MKKCRHDRYILFCCECKYGKIKEVNNPHTFDLVDELRVGVGFKLSKGD